MPRNGQCGNVQKQLLSQLCLEGTAALPFVHVEGLHTRIDAMHCSTFPITHSVHAPVHHIVKSSCTMQHQSARMVMKHLYKKHCGSTTKQLRLMYSVQS